MGIIYRKRGRPRSKNLGPDLGTPEMQRNRNQRQEALGVKNLNHRHIYDYLAGSQLHAFLLMGWIEENLLNSALAYGRLLAKAHQSMGLPLRLKSSLRAIHEHSAYHPWESAKIEALWQKVNCQLQQTFTIKGLRMLNALFLPTPAPWPPKREEIVALLQQLHEVMKKI